MHTWKGITLLECENQKELSEERQLLLLTQNVTSNTKHGYQNIVKVNVS